MLSIIQCRSIIWYLTKKKDCPRKITCLLQLHSKLGKKGVCCMVYVKENISKIWQNFALFNGETNGVVWFVLMSTWVGTTVPTHVD